MPFGYATVYLSDFHVPTRLWILLSFSLALKENTLTLSNTVTTIMASTHRVFNIVLISPPLYFVWHYYTIKESTYMPKSRCHRMRCLHPLSVRLEYPLSFLDYLRRSNLNYCRLCFSNHRHITAPLYIILRHIPIQYGGSYILDSHHVFLLLWVSSLSQYNFWACSGPVLLLHLKIISNII